MDHQGVQSLIQELPTRSVSGSSVSPLVSERALQQLLLTRCFLRPADLTRAPFGVTHAQGFPCGEPGAVTTRAVVRSRHRLAGRLWMRNGSWGEDDGPEEDILRSAFRKLQAAHEAMKRRREPSRS